MNGIQALLNRALRCSDKMLRTPQALHERNSDFSKQSIALLKQNAPTPQALHERNSGASKQSIALLTQNASNAAGFIP
jgi:hypothetical protein